MPRRLYHTGRMGMVLVRMGTCWVHPLRDDRLKLGRSLLRDAVTGLENVRARMRQSFAESAASGASPQGWLRPTTIATGNLIILKLPREPSRLKCAYMAEAPKRIRPDREIVVRFVKHLSSEVDYELVRMFWNQYTAL